MEDIQQAPKLFGKYDYAVQVNAPGLAEYINLRPTILPHSGGRHVKKRFWKNKINIVERLINKISVTGHSSLSRKHIFTSGRNTGKKQKAIAAVSAAFDQISAKTGKNPIELLVRAIENSAPRGETTAVMMGGVRRPVSVDVSPQRRVDLALGIITKGCFNKSRGSNRNLTMVLVDELIAAAANDPKSFAVEKKINTERQAEAAK
ncbi:MAG: 30S ribosomal protein S7 [archaeon]